MIDKLELPVGKFYLREYSFARQLAHHLPGWQDKIVSATRELALAVRVDPNLVGSREDPDNLSTPTIYTVPTNIIHEHEDLKVLVDLYRGPILKLARVAFAHPLIAAQDLRNCLNLNIQFSQRTAELKGEVSAGCDAHVDYNALSALLYLSRGGELIISRNAQALGARAITQDCIRIQPEPGKLVLFNGRYPHFVVGSDEDRVAAAMNFYSPDYPEDIRPTEVAGYAEGAVHERGLE